MILSQMKILEQVNKTDAWEDRLIVEPFFPDSINKQSASASLDFHLGNRFTLLQGRRASQHDPLSKEPRQDVVVRELFIPRGEEFALRAGQIVLGTTLEWFRFPYNLMAYVIGRSIWARRGLKIEGAAVVHPRSSGRITLELSNDSEVGIKLKPGVAIGQLVFQKLDISDASLEARDSTFSGAHRPILGKYKTSAVEELLLNS